MVMEVLSRLLSATTSLPDFAFHYKCAKINLNHLCFANDLMIFAYGSECVVKIYTDILARFENMSGLKANVSKSSIFFSGVEGGMKARILQISGYKEEKLPIRYLGVPLITSKLSKRNCESLIERISSRMESWTAKYLSYVGRLQLVKSVIFSVFKAIGVACLSFLKNSFILLSKNVLISYGLVLK